MHKIYIVIEGGEGTFYDHFLLIDDSSSKSHLT